MVSLQRVREKRGIAHRDEHELALEHWAPASAGLRIGGALSLDVIP